MEQNGVLIDASCSRAEPEFAARTAGAAAAGTCAGRRARSTSTRPSSCSRSCSSSCSCRWCGKTPTGQPSTAEDVLEELAADYALPRLMLEYRGAPKLKSTYTDKLPEQVNERTGRMHTNYAQAVAATGRLSSIDPNLQNIPVRTRGGPAHPPGFRGARRATCCWPPTTRRSSCASWRTCPGDASLRQGLCRASATCTGHRRGGLRACKPAAVSAEQRRAAKAINFGLIYGMSRLRPRTQPRHRARRGAAATWTVLRALSRASSASWTARARRRANTATWRRCSAGACICRTSARATSSCASTPSAAPSTRPCRAPPPTSSSAP